MNSLLWQRCIGKRRKAQQPNFVLSCAHVQMFIDTVNKHYENIPWPLILHFLPVPALAVLLPSVPLAAQLLVAAPLPLLAAVQPLVAEQLQLLVAAQQLHCMPQPTNNGGFNSASSQVGIGDGKYLKPPEHHLPIQLAPT
jgi:hypothetical protein